MGFTKKLSLCALLVLQRCAAKFFLEKSAEGMVAVETADKADVGYLLLTFFKELLCVDQAQSVNVFIESDVLDLAEVVRYIVTVGSKFA